MTRHTVLHHHDGSSYLILREIPSQMSQSNTPPSMHERDFTPKSRRGSTQSSVDTLRTQSSGQSSAPRIAGLIMDIGTILETRYDDPYARTPSPKKYRVPSHSFDTGDITYKHDVDKHDEDKPESDSTKLLPPPNLSSHHSLSFDLNADRKPKPSLLRQSTQKLKRVYTLFSFGGEGRAPLTSQQEWPDEEAEHNLYDYHDEPLEKEEEAPAPEVNPFLVSYGSDDPRHPYNWPDRKKYIILGVMCSAAMCVTVGSSIQASTDTQLMADFNVNRATVVAGVSLYVLGFGVGAGKSTCE